MTGSQGFITYQIKIKDGLDIGTTILNDAKIYFDFNEPFFTNIASTQLIETSSINTLPDNPRATKYPNLSSGVAYIEHNCKIESYKIFDVQGSMQMMKCGTQKIDLGS